MLTRHSISIMSALWISTITSVTATERDSINIVGSTTVAPFAIAVGEHFSQATHLRPPQIQAIGSGAGLKLFCSGAGAETPDIAIAVRPIKPTEKEACEQHGIRDITEINIGTIATVVVQSNTTAKIGNLTRKNLFLAMAKEVPDPKNGAKLVPNPYKTWKDIDPSLPNTKITIWVPAEMHGTHDIVMNQILLAGCQQIDTMKTLTGNDPKTLTTTCTQPREDGAYVEFKDYGAAIKEVQTNPYALGIMAQNQFGQDAGLNTIAVDGYEPSAPSIAYSVYPLTESLRFYVKTAHLSSVAGLQDYLAELTSEAAIGTNRGYLSAIGMVTLPLPSRTQARTSVANLATHSLR